MYLNIIVLLYMNDLPTADIVVMLCYDMFVTFNNWTKQDRVISWFSYYLKPWEDR